MLAATGVGLNVVLSDPQGQQLLNTLKAPGEALPRHGNPSSVEQVLTTGKAAISPLYTGGVLGKPVLSIDVPVWRQGQVRQVLSLGLLPADFALDQPGSPYLAPQVLTDVHHGMRVMTEESFGPVVGIQKVRDDEEALALMNDSEFGLTAAIFSADAEAAMALAERVEAGTVFLNRCDYLDPALAWTGVKNSGRGCTLSSVGYEQLTRPKSFHFKTRL